MRKSLLIGSLLAFQLGGVAQIITTVAGNGTQGFSGDGGIATSAELNYPSWVQVDTSGNIYVGDYGNHRIRKVDNLGIITTIVGTGSGASFGDGGAATAAGISSTDHCLDSIGNIYIGDDIPAVIRKVDISSGIISTIGGSGNLGCSGDGGPASQASFDQPDIVVFDKYWNLYVADNSGTIRVINHAGIINAFAGVCGSYGYSGDGGPAISAQLNGQGGVAFDKKGNGFIADANNNVIRKVDTSGIITTVVGTGAAGYSGDGGPATQATLRVPSLPTFDKVGNMYIPDWNNHVVRKVDTLGIITTVAGTGVAGYNGDGGLATNSQLSNPCKLAFDKLGNLYIADASNHRIRKLSFIEDIKADRHTQISVFPNPASSIIRIISSLESGEIKITDVLGNKVVSQKLEGNTQEEIIDISGLNDGVYFLSATSEGKTHTEKFIVQH